jgi:hypothetical protein
MSRHKHSISSLVLIAPLLITSCATTVSYYGEKLTAAEVGTVRLHLDDSQDNSELRDNQFLKDKILAAVTAKLQERGITAVSGLRAKDAGVTHVLILNSGGVSKHTGVRPVTTTQNYQSGINAQGQAYSYSTPKVSGGGTYSVTLVNVTAGLYSVDGNGDLTEVCRSYAKGDGQNLLEQRLRSSVVVPNKQLKERYIRVFTDAASSVFQVRR